MRQPRPALAELCTRPYDLLIAGGGINGLGLAREAALRGLSALVVDAQDFAFGASSRSTKLAHGGLRYLEQGAFSLVRESLRERRALAETLAPHLVRPLPFLLPAWKGEARRPWKLRAGLWLYDLLALQGGGGLGRHRWLAPAAARALAPGLEPGGLLGAGEFWDCQMDDARLALETLFDAERLGARALNYCSLQGASRLAEGEVRVRLRDEESGLEAEASGRLLVLAGGAWTDRMMERLGLGSIPARVRPSKGVHLVTRRLLDGHALLLPSRSDRRLLFVIPWELEGRPASLVGTTDTDFGGDPDHLRAEEDEIAYLLGELARALPGEKLGRHEVLASFAGLRPLLAPAGPGAASNSQLSREHAVWEEPGLLAVAGGKYTTYRSLCQGLLLRAAQRLKLPADPGPLSLSPLPGVPRAGEARGEALAREVQREARLGFPEAALLVSHYGRLARDVAALAMEDPELGKPLAPGSGCPAILAMAAWAARHEHAVHLDDFYLRRTRLGLRLPPDHRGVEKAAAAMGQVLWWSREREAEELQRLKRVVEGEYR